MKTIHLLSLKNSGDRKISQVRDAKRRPNKAKVKEIEKGQKEEFFEQRCKQGREDFLKKLTGGSDI